MSVSKNERKKNWSCVLWASRIAFVLMTLVLCSLFVYVGVLSFLPVGYYIVAIAGAVVLCTAMFLALFLRKRAGVYGVNCSIDTLEALYDIEVNYYVKVNFASLVNIVDAVGGVTVQSDYDFSISKYTFKKGTNYLTGEEALVFVRYRYNLPGGDMQRGVHQQRVIQAVIKKITSPAIIPNFTSVLNAITDNIKTNLSSDSMNELIQMQLSDMATWDVQTYAMFGNGLMGTLYAFGTQDKYPVLSAPEEQVTVIKALIQQTMQVK